MEDIFNTIFELRSGSASVPSAQGMEHSHSSASISRNFSSGSALGELNGEGTHPKGNTHFMRKIPPGAEASNILVGEVDFLEKTLSAFIRLNHANFLGDLTEVPVPTRFLFILLGPTGGLANFHEVGRAMATLMSDEVFHDVAYKARNRNHLLAAIDEFLDAVTVLPPGEWDPTIRIEPPAAIPSQDQRKRPPEKKEEFDEEEDEQKLREETGLARSGRWFGGLMNDIKRKTPWYWSDFRDALALQCIASFIFLYFACLSPIITFGGLLGHATGNNMAAMESLVSGFVCGLGYGFFSGQPLTILGSTGPVLVFETIMYDFCQDQGLDYMSFRFWIGMWIAIILLFLVAVDASALVCYITRFTEENFATLIAFIFIYKAIENVLSIGKKFPVNTQGDIQLNYECFCAPTNGSSVLANVSWQNMSKEECLLRNGTMMGAGCDTPHYVPDVFLMSIILFLGTFLLSIQLKDFKNALFFPSKVRQVVSDFAVIIAILSMTGLDFFVGISTPKLQVNRLNIRGIVDIRGEFAIGILCRDRPKYLQCFIYGDAFLDQIVTGDETWVSHNTPETKRQSRQWHHPSSPKKPRKFKQTLSTQKVMATVFWDRKGFLLLDFMPKGTTINANRYCETLRKLLRAIQNKRRGMFSRGVVLLHDNVRPRTAASTRELLDQFGWEIFDHPPYSPDLAPSDFDLFTKLKDFLGGTRFGSDEELKKTVNTWLNELAAEEYKTGILKLVNRYDKCLNVGGDYVEK
ncbi:hypothetical protein ANN_11913 [Periplaneta americana]|uniref:Anion exchange protein n=1 Tax=Periplaneta americana TaxID=6978 RepID=A0ABQ8T6C7_PERAM|nr:hypothetical protein ANN_11913 [Periplaneta americana]